MIYEIAPKKRKEKKRKGKGEKERGEGERGKVICKTAPEKKKRIKGIKRKENKGKADKTDVSKAYDMQ